MRGRKPNVEVTPNKYHQTTSGVVGRDGYKYKITIPRAGGKESATYYYDFRGHPLRALVAGFLLRDEGDVTAGTVNNRCVGLRILGEFMAVAGARDLTPGVFKSFVRWLGDAEKPGGKRRFAETSYVAYATNVEALYEYGLLRNRPGWNQRDLETMVATSDNMLRGWQRRAAQNCVDKAMSLESFASLFRVVALELDECRRVLDERNAGRRRSLYNLGVRYAGMIDPNPFVVLALEAGMLLGMRASELNTLTPADVRVDPANGNHELYIHAPDKADDFIPVDDAFIETLRVCEEWSKEARRMAGEGGEKLFEDALLVYPPTNTGCREPLIQINTYSLLRSHLPYFYRKWFTRTAGGGDGDGRPLLHADGDPTRPFWIDYRKIRNAFAARFAEREKNRAATQRAMRHRSMETTERHYLHATRLDHARKVQIALKAESYALALGLKSTVAVGVSDETLERARRAGAMTPHGICGSALDGNDCVSASGCLVCPHLVVVESRGPRFAADRDAYLKRAETLNAAGDLRGAENALSLAKLCQAHLNRINDSKGVV